MHHRFHTSLSARLLARSFKRACLAFIALLAATQAEAQDAFIEVGEPMVDELGLEYTKWTPINETLVIQQAAHFFDILPSATGFRTIADVVRTQEVALRCVRFDGTVIQFCNFALTLTRTPNDAGHDHDDANRPVGAFNPATGDSGSDGIFRTVYTAPDVSGVVNLRSDASGPNGEFVFPLITTISVRVPGLVALGPGASYTLTGQTATHGDNHYGVARFNNKLVQVANFWVLSRGTIIPYNDMSLVRGGMFDINANWLRPHTSHRFGQDVDTFIPPVDDRSLFRIVTTAAGLHLIIEEGNHWHLREFNAAPTGPAAPPP